MQQVEVKTPPVSPQTHKDVDFGQCLYVVYQHIGEIRLKEITVKSVTKKGVISESNMNTIYSYDKCFYELRNALMEIERLATETIYDEVDNKINWKLN